MNRHSSKDGYRNSFRIIAGNWRSRRLYFPDDVDSLRPTTDRIRETLFNWLQQKIAGARCLDLYSGSGALAFEAVSRSAASVIAIEASAKAVSAIRDNCRLLECTAIDAVAGDGLHWLKANAGKQVFDVIFLDPPYRQDLLPESIRLLESGGFPAPGCVIYMESDYPLENLPLPQAWRLLRSKKAGQVYYGVCERVIE